MRILAEVTAVFAGLIALWLATVVVTVLPTFSPASLPIWAVIAAMALGIPLTSLASIESSADPRFDPRHRVALAASGLAALGIAAVVLIGFFGSSVSEMVLLPIGIVFAIHGLAAAWLAVLPRESESDRSPRPYPERL
jgi:MFS family permease